MDTTTKTTGRKLASANQPGATKDDNDCEKKEKMSDNRKELSSVFRGKTHVSLRTSNHAVKQARTILIGSSTLSHLWKTPTFKPSNPMDFDCLIGGKVSDVRIMFLRTYSDCEIPLNVIVCCGVNDVPVHSSDETIQELKKLAQAIMEHNENNKIVLSTILFPPKFCDRGRPDYINHIHRIKKINSWIKSFNAEKTGLTLDMSKYGISKNFSVNDRIQFVYEDWKEEEIHKKLHLSYNVKKKVAVEVTEICNALQYKKKVKIPQKAVASSDQEHGTLKSHDDVVYEQMKILEDVKKKKKENETLKKDQIRKPERIISSFPPGHPLWRWNCTVQNQNEIKSAKRKTNLRKTVAMAQIPQKIQGVTEIRTEGGKKMKVRKSQIKKSKLKTLTEENQILIGNHKKRIFYHQITNLLTSCPCRTKMKMLKKQTAVMASIA